MASVPAPYPLAPPSARIFCVEVKSNYPTPSELPRNAKILHFVRHGEAQHNLVAMQLERSSGKRACNCPGECLYKDESLIDAALTQKGRRQSLAAGNRILAHGPFPEIAIASPTRRTLQTAQVALSNGGLRDLKCVVIEGCRERYGVHLADKRSARADVESSFPGFDFSAIDHGPDVRFSATKREQVEELVARSRGFFWSLKDRPENCIALFTHSSFLLNSIKHSFETFDKSVVRGFQNGEHRCVVLTFEHD